VGKALGAAGRVFDWRGRRRRRAESNCNQSRAWHNFRLTMAGNLMSRKSVARARMQGNLDGLCGVYSVVNASLRLIPSQWTEDQVRSLFRRLCSQLAAEGRLEDTLFEGMTVRVLGRLIDAASEFMKTEKGISINRKIAFGSAPKGLAEFWSSLENHLQGERVSVILGIGGKHDHWTCVGSISSDQMKLVDSDGLRQLRRGHCTVAEEKKGRHHVLWPTQTFLLTAT